MTPLMGDDPERTANARRRGRRAAHAVVIAIAVVFVGASAVQIIPAVFRVPVGPMGSPASAGSPEEACARGVRSLATAIDRAAATVWSGPPIAGRSDDALSAFRHAALPEWSDADRVERACDRVKGGPEAWAALARLRRAEEQVLLRTAADLEPLRREVTAHLPADLR
jgi:hypothetical protein